MLFADKGLLLLQEQGLGKEGPAGRERRLRANKGADGSAATGLCRVPRAGGGEQPSSPWTSVALPCPDLGEVEWGGSPGNSDGSHQLLSSDHVAMALALGAHSVLTTLREGSRTHCTRKETVALEMKGPAPAVTVGGGNGSGCLEKPACSGRYPVGTGRVSPRAYCQVTVTCWETQGLINGIVQSVAASAGQLGGISWWSRGPRK